MATDCSIDWVPIRTRKHLYNFATTVIVDRVFTSANRKDSIVPYHCYTNLVYVLQGVSAITRQFHFLKLFKKWKCPVSPLFNGVGFDLIPSETGKSHVYVRAKRHFKRQILTTLTVFTLFHCAWDEKQLESKALWTIPAVQTQTACKNCLVNKDLITENVASKVGSPTWSPAARGAFHGVFFPRFFRPFFHSVVFFPLLTLRDKCKRTRVPI